MDRLGTEVLVRRWRWRLMAMLGLALVGVGAGVTWGTGFAWMDGAGAAAAGDEGSSPQRPPPPPEPAPPPAPREMTEREREVAGALEVVKEACALLKQPDLTSYEVAARLGTPYGERAEYEKPNHSARIAFEARSPLLVEQGEDALPSEILGGNTPTSISWVHLRVARYGLITLADLERAFGPARIVDSIAKEVAFSWEPSAEGLVHCRIEASVWGTLYDDADQTHRRLAPMLDHHRAYIEDFHVVRGTFDKEGVLWIGLVEPPPELPDRGDSAPPTVPQAQQGQTP